MEHAPTQREELIREHFDTKQAGLVEAILTCHEAHHISTPPPNDDARAYQCFQDVTFQLQALTGALSLSEPALFMEYVVWCRMRLERLGMPATELAVRLQCLQEVLAQRLPEPLASEVAEYVLTGMDELSQPVMAPPSVLSEGEPLVDLARSYLLTLLHGDRQAARQLVMDAVESGVSVQDIYLYVFQRSLEELGRLWERNEVTVAQEHYCTAATQLIMSYLYTRVFAPNHKRGIFYKRATLVVACVEGELHEVGARMVADFLEQDGWRTLYLGANTPVPDLLRWLVEHEAHLLAVSAAMTGHVRAVRELIRAVRQNPDTQQIKVIVGGRIFNRVESLWRKVEADGTAPDAREAVNLMRSISG